MVLAILRRELLGSGRKGRLYTVRAGYLLLLGAVTLPALVAMVDVVNGAATPGYVSHGSPPPYTPPHAALSARGARFTLYFGWFQLALVALVGPALSATAVTQEKASGVLELLAAAGTRAWQVVVGKVASRTLWLGLCVLSGVPLLFAGTLMGGAGLETVALLGSHCLAAALLSTAIGTLFSGAFRRPLACLLAAYTVLAVLYVVPLFLAAISSYTIHGYPTSPGRALLVASGPMAIAFATAGTISSWYAWVALLPPLAFSAAFLLASIPFARHEPETTRRDAVAKAGVALLEGSVSGLRKAGRIVERPSQPVGRNPVAWREARAYRYGFSSRVLRLVWITVGGAIAVHLFAFSVLGDVPRLARFGVGVFTLGAAALTLVVSATSLAAEHEAGTLELLRISRLSSVEIAAGKLLGLARFLWPVIALPVIPALAFVGADTKAFFLSLALVALLVLAAASLGLFFSTRFRRASAAISAALGCVIGWIALVPFIAYWMPIDVYQAKKLFAVLHPVASVTAIVQSFAPDPRVGWRYHSGHYHSEDLSDFFELTSFGWLGVGLIAFLGALALFGAARRLDRIS